MSTPGSPADTQKNAAEELESKRGKRMRISIEAHSGVPIYAMQFAGAEVVEVLAP